MPKINDNTFTKRQVQECSLQHCLSINKLVQLFNRIVYSHEKERTVPAISCMNPTNIMERARHRSVHIACSRYIKFKNRIRYLCC